MRVIFGFYNNNFCLIPIPILKNNPNKSINGNEIDFHSHSLFQCSKCDLIVSVLTTKLLGNLTPVYLRTLEHQNTLKSLSLKHQPYSMYLL